MCKRVCITTGYMGSGSSALTDLLSEFDGFEAPNNSFEYVFLHCPNGLFDLEDKLLRGNNANRSDEAIHSFISAMNVLFTLSEKDFWPAGYKKNISASFMNYVYDFVNNLGTYSSNSTWYYQQVPTYLMRIEYKCLRIMSKLSGGHFKFNRPVRYKDMLLAFPSEKEFYTAASTFIRKVLSDLSGSAENLILDQFVLPHNLFRISDYFGTDSDYYFFVVDRDPRDVFISNKYFWRNNRVPYPIDVDEFCRTYNKIRENEKPSHDKRIVRFHFEDFIYKYNESVDLLSNILNVNRDDFKGPKKFIPEKSIDNTQLFLLNDEYKAESEIIFQSLNKYCYKFPYKRIPQGEVF